MEYREVNRLRRLCTVQGFQAVGWYGRLLCGRHLPLSQLHLESAAEFCWIWNTSIRFPTPPINGFTYTISKGFVKIWIQKSSLSRKLYKLNYLRTTWQPPAVPPATSSHPTLIRPVSGSIARDRTRSFTVNLMAFSGETPCVVGHQVEPVDTFISTYNKLWAETSVKSQKTFIAEDLLGTIYTIFVEHLANNCWPLILHAAIINWVHDR